MITVNCGALRRGLTQVNGLVDTSTIDRQAGTSSTMQFYVRDAPQHSLDSVMIHSHYLLFTGV